MLLVVGMLLVGGCAYPPPMWFDKQNTLKLNQLNQRQQYFDKHLNLSPQMKQLMVDKEKLYFAPLTEEEDEFATQAAGTIIAWTLIWWCLL